MYQIKYELLQTLAGKHRVYLHHSKIEVSEMNRNTSQLQAETEALKGQGPSLEAAITNAEHHGELTLKDAQVKVAELEDALKRPSRTWPCSCANTRSS